MSKKRKGLKFYLGRVHFIESTWDVKLQETLEWLQSYQLVTQMPIGKAREVQQAITTIKAEQYKRRQKAREKGGTAC